MGRRASRQGAEVVAALQHRDHAAVGVSAGGVGDEAGDPREVVLGQQQVAERVPGVRVEAGGDENEFGAEGVQRRQPVPFHGGPKRPSVRAGRQRRVDDVRPPHILQAVGVVRKLEAGAHQHARRLGEGRHRAVAVVNVEVQDGHPFHARPRQGVRRRHRHAVQETETHRRGLLRMMAGRTHRAENAPLVRVQHQVHPAHRRASRRERRRQRARAKRGV